MEKYIIDKIKDISQIPDYKFTGYYWWSNSDKPEMLFEEALPKEKILASVNPFCVEALLYSKTEGISIHIQHTGKYLVTAFDLKKLDKLDTVQKEYIPHKLDQVKKVIFTQVWEEVLLEVDETTSFPSLKPTALIFSGFNYQ
ncbi:TIGR04423 family type III CRISPR-associated protein [Algoriphagus kandeliae]|uniref:TIGR04423 family type III CRISPR-associated protein n=1 Tax=Algoriphagus kandeliae TaxID=2562278 RepID=A0A4Y9QRN3_9BACT|nr:TIGR04423 family type III CRISPR-associated protein [Algoriphagus kandeliae]TFV94468.1 TIGR04423 family type III CRISPR-associated protein [Algoriphagus kandeliae]